MWYGVCQRNKTKIKNCYYDGQPKLLENSTAIEMLHEICPRLVTLKEETFTCCDIEQINDLSSSVKMAAIFLQRCPSCYANFLQILCEFTCSPRQSKFIDVRKIETLKDDRKSQISSSCIYFKIYVFYFL